jgi:hypothetical protein
MTELINAVLNDDAFPNVLRMARNIIVYGFALIGLAWYIGWLK